jgi:predicted dehydrogenase
MTTDWNPVLRGEFAKPYWGELQQFVAAERGRATVYPPHDEVFAARHNDRQLTGDPNVLAAATTSGLYRGEVEDYGAALISGPGGEIFGLEAGYTHGHLEASDQEFRVAGQGAYIVERGTEVTVVTPDGERIRHGLSVAERYVRFVVDTLERIDTGRPPVATLEDCWRAMSLIDAIYRAAQEGHDALRHSGVPER